MENFPSDLADFAVAHLGKLGAKYTEARIENNEGNSYVLKNGVPEIAGYEKSTGIGIRFLVNGCFGFVATNKLDKTKLMDLLRDSFRSTFRASRSITEKSGISDEKSIRAKEIKKPKINPLNISAEEKLSFLFDIEKEIGKTKMDVPSRYFSLSDMHVKKYYANSEGTKILDDFPFVSCYYFITMKIGNELAQRYWQHGNKDGWEAAKRWNLKTTLMNDLNALYKNVKFGVKAPKGKVDLVTGAEVTGIIAHESGGHPYEADRIMGREAAQAGESFVTVDSVGKRMASEAVNVVDDPAVSASPGNYKYDDEGVKARRKFLIKDGRIHEFLHNRETAWSMGLQSNGSARSSGYDREALIRMSNTFFLPGKHSFNELVEDIKFGIYLKNFNEWNIDDKRLNQKYVGGEAYLIKNGAICEPVKAPIIEIDTYRLYSSIDAISNDKLELHAATCGKGEPMQGMPVYMGGPSLRIRNIRLGSPNKSS